MRVDWLPPLTTGHLLSLCLMCPRKNMVPWTLPTSWTYLTLRYQHHRLKNRSTCRNITTTATAVSTITSITRPEAVAICHQRLLHSGWMQKPRTNVRFERKNCTDKLLPARWRLVKTATEVDTVDFEHCTWVYTCYSTQFTASMSTRCELWVDG